MFPALQANDIILVKRKYWDFQKKDIIIFLNNIDSIIMIKRIYATYSDTIFINSNFKKTYFSSQSLNNSEIIKNKNIDDSLVLVDKNSFFVMGDNFQESMDSRHFGLVSQKNIFGKATIILFNYHNGKFRWDRFMKKIE
jgi:signal peptidase I